MLRRDGLHARFSYRQSRNLGKLLKEADGARARFVAIVGDEIADRMITVKNLASGDQRLVPVADLPDAVRDTAG